uniref:IrrE N-terminal-like domain-containing protein n=1 Tax=Candidatus Kentrum sp. MB TaxID=2138164 RepID=A0A450XP55_9GAMM|nr:MAG: protein of unknown function (DUF955) [Candidatus Kentron sp. MB]
MNNYNEFTFLKYHGLSAQELLEKLDSESHGFSINVPINVNMIPGLLGAKLDESVKLTANEISMAGSVTVEVDNPVIWVNPIENLYPPRKRFTIAHEIGHLVLHIDPKTGVREFIDTKKTLTRRDYHWDIEEYEANNFAAQLLMPTDLLNECGNRIISSYIKKTKKDKMPTSAFMLEMSDLFDVSEPAMRFRLKNIGAIK